MSMNNIELAQIIKNIIEEELKLKTISKKQKNAILAFSAKDGEHEMDYDMSDSEIYNEIYMLIHKQPELKLYRGIGLSETLLGEYLDHDWIKNNINLEEGLKSFTTNKQRAHSFGTGEVHITFILKIKNYLDITPYSLYNEQEYITNNLKWKITKEPRLIRPGSWEVYGKEI